MLSSSVGGSLLSLAMNKLVGSCLWVLSGHKLCFFLVKGTFAFLLVFGFIATFSVAWSPMYDNLDFRAEGNGITDSSNSLSEAWKYACNAEVDQATVNIPKGKIFLVKPIMFSGPCRPKIISFKISGQLVAPSSPIAWEGLHPGQWITFDNVQGLQVNGHGIVDGQGTEWWNQSCKKNPKLVNCTRLAPTAMKFRKCKDCNISDLHFIDSPQAHISILECNNIRISNLKIDAPGDSPNTDGIHIHRSNQITINKTWIGSGDDCISIQDYTSNIKITNVHCGPGHGVSIGSLGKSGNYVQVRNILVKDVKFFETSNGARIKTWQVGKGYVRNVIFKNLLFQNVKNPIIIDQNYGDKERGNSTELTSGVHISDVVYSFILGTSRSKVAISLKCSKSVACTNIRMNSINLSAEKPGESVYSNCTNAYGWSEDVHPSSCLIN